MFTVFEDPKEEEIQLIPKGITKKPLCGAGIQSLYFKIYFEINGLNEKRNDDWYGVECPVCVYTTTV
jgi:hypothetical protein